jgi:hypothetical protein
MATLAEFRAQYPQYDEVPDVKLADSLYEKFYTKIPKIEFYKTIGLGTAAAIPGAENVITGKTAPEVSWRDRIMGAIETPLAVGATLGGAAIAPFVGIAGTLASGKFGTQEGIQAGQEAMKAVQYQPRTQTAREALGAVGEFIQPVTSALPPTLGATGSTLNALAPSVAMQANALARPAIRQATAPIQNAMTSMMTREQPPMVGMGAASTSEDLARQVRLDKFGIRATSGERDKNLQMQQFESDVERSALSGISEKTKSELARKYGAFKVGQKQDILNQFEKMTQEVGGTIDRASPRTLGKFVDKTIVNLYTKEFDDYKALYAKADNAGETLEQVKYQSLLDYIGTKSPTRREKLDPILNDVAELLAMSDPQKTGKISIRNLEDIYQVVGTAKDSPSAKPLKDLITQIGDGAGGKLYQESRQARAKLADKFENVKRVNDLLSTKPGTTDRKIAFDDVYNHVVVDGSLEEMKTVTQLLKGGGPEGQQAYKEFQGYTLQRMKDLLLKKGEESDAVRLNNFNNFIIDLDREDKLGYLFSKTGRDTLIDIKQSISDVMVKEPGAVNYPNTAGAVLRGIEALQNLPFKIPGAETAAQFARGRQYKKQLEKTLLQPNALAPPVQSTNALRP